MLGKIKKALGIEGVKVQLTVESVDKKQQLITGMVKFTTKTDSKVRSFNLSLTETYSRGRGKSKLTDEYILGEHRHSTSFSIAQDEIVEVPFSLDYGRMQSEMDKLQKGNFLTGVIIGFAKKLKGVSSTFKCKVEADIVGTKLDPFDTVEVELT